SLHGSAASYALSVLDRRDVGPSLRWRNSKWLLSSRFSRTARMRRNLPVQGPLQAKLSPEGMRSSMASRQKRYYWKASATEFETFREGLYREHDPQTASQCQLVEIIASHFWRLRRTPGFEARLLNRHTGSSENQQAKRLIFLGWNDVPGGPDPDLPGALDPARDGTTPVQPEKEDCPDDTEQSEPVRVIQFGQKSEPSEAPAYSRLETIDRHETSLINGLIKALHLLSVLQSRR